VVAPLAVWYSHEARAYALFMLLALAAIYAQLVVFRRGATWAWLLFAFASATLLWTHYFAVLQVGVQLLACVVAAWSRHRHGKPVLLPLLLPAAAVLLVLAAACAPLVPFALDQAQANFGQGSPADELPAQAGQDVSGLASQPTVYALGANLVWAVWGYHSDPVMAQIVGLWPLAMLLALALLGRGRAPTTSLLVACVVVPVAALFLLGFRTRIAFEVRQFAGTVPLLLLLIARFTTGVPRRAFAAGLATAAVLATLVVGLADQQLNNENPRIHDVRGAVEETVRRAGPGDVLVYSPPFLGDVVRYYGQELNQVRPQSPGALDDPDARVFLLGGFLDDPRHAGTVGAALAQLEEGDWEVVDQIERPGVRVWVLEPDPAAR
jgi:hypothetical protein